MEAALSTQKKLDVSGISHITIRVVLEYQKIHPYKTIKVQELKEDDNNQRVEFYEVISHQIIIGNPNCFFSEECSPTI